ncbi:MAG: 30S ribosomal protein S8 [Candidatus Omnitrophica bacterium]|nr:30S ribosomal protein S8 [Candidatus Omnitrophota bacterium]
MSLNDPIADFLCCIQNASKAKKETLTLPASNRTLRIVEILKEERFIKSFKLIEDGNKRSVRIHLRYLKGNRPAIKKIKKVTKPGLRQYVGVKKIPRVLSGLGVAILSTPKGIITDAQARKDKVGGEVICKIW